MAYKHGTLRILEEPVAAYCSIDCQTKYLLEHWNRILQTTTEKERLDKLLAHVHAVKYRKKTETNQHKHLCVYESIAQDCIICKEVVTWITLLAKQDILESQANLAYCYQLGLGVPKSMVEAVTWYTRAAAGGHTNSLVYLEQLLGGLGGEPTELEVSDTESNP